MSTSDEVLTAIEAMVRNAAHKSMPSSRFIPKFDIAFWSEEDRAEVVDALDAYVDARLEARFAAYFVAYTEMVEKRWAA